MRNGYEKSMVDSVGVVAVAVPWSLIALDCTADQTIKPFTGMQNIRNGP